MLEKTLESPWDYKEIQPVHPKGDKWIFIGRSVAEAEAPVLWSPDVKSWLIGKDPDAGKDRGQEEKRMTEDETVGWHHWLSGHEFEQALGDGHGQGGLACCSLWGRKESDRTERLSNNHLYVESLKKSYRLTLTKQEYIRREQTPLPTRRWGSGLGGLD